MARSAMSANAPEQTWEEKRNLALGRLNDAGFGWWIVLVAGLGFLTDAYHVGDRELRHGLPHGTSR